MRFHKPSDLTRESAPARMEAYKLGATCKPVDVIEARRQHTVGL